MRAASTAYGSVGRLDGSDAREAPPAKSPRRFSTSRRWRKSSSISVSAASRSATTALCSPTAPTTDGSERYRLSVKDLRAGEMLADEIEETTGNAVWTADDASFFYTVVDANWRPWQVRRPRARRTRRAGIPWCTKRLTPASSSMCRDTASREYIVVNTGDIVTSEVRLIPASDPDC